MNRRKSVSHKRPRVSFGQGEAVKAQLEWLPTKRGWNGLVKKLRVELLAANPDVADSEPWQTIQHQIDQAIAEIVWPAGSTSFTINPVKNGNGVVPLKEAFVLSLKGDGWTPEPRNLPTVGRVDACIQTEVGLFALEWETGNISSSHRSLNRLALGLLHHTLAGGILVLPSRALYTYLTDRIGNFQELEPYVPLYRSLPLTHGVLAVVEVEHDAVDTSVPFIRKGTDGWALVQRPPASDDR